MLTKNAKIIISAMPSPHFPVPPTSTSKCLIPIKDLNGTKRYILGGVVGGGVPSSIITTQLRSVTMINQDSRTASVGFAIGSGSTPPTEDDYTLENQIYGDIVGSSPIIETDGFIFAERKYYVTYDWTIKNKKDSAIVIREMGMFKVFTSTATQGASKQSSSRETFMNEASVMFDRVVLDNPVTIPPDQSGTVRYRFDYDWTIPS